MTLVQGILLGILQGFTEFLPISSSGHLVLLQNFWDIKTPGVFFEVSVHFGTLISIVIVYFKDISSIINEFLKVIKELWNGTLSKNHSQYRNLMFMIIIGTIPTGLIGILLKDIFETFYSSNIIPAFFLIITGFILYSSTRIREGKKDFHSIRVTDSIIIGLAQGFAISPGISRSGTTIVAGLSRGLDRAVATRYSFLLSIPAILGATLLELRTVITSPVETLPITIIIGAILSSAISGIIAIKILVRFLKEGKLHLFAYYCWAIGIILILKTYML